MAIERILAEAIEKFLSYGTKYNCSDVHIATGCVPMLRIDGDIMPIKGAPVLDKKHVMDMLRSIMTEVQLKTYEEKWELDFSMQIENDLRFRVNAFNTINGPAAAFRQIPTEIKSLSELGVPPIVTDLASAMRGLVLVVGPTGSGKSTTIAGLVDQINENYTRHIITIEDPIEFIHKNKKSLINQREVGTSTLSFDGALKSALREDPNVIVVGEMRDIETVRLALTAAETGHLVLTTLHTNSAAQTINRIIDVFPPDEKTVVRSMLSTSIKAIISQRLLKKQGGGRCAAFEVMLANASIRNLIREDKIPQINSIIELGKKSGMLMMKDSIAGLLRQGAISQEIADEFLLANE